jgi:hypothetical protein
MVFIISPLCKIAPLERHYKKSRLVLPKKKMPKFYFYAIFHQISPPGFSQFSQKELSLCKN